MVSSKNILKDKKLFILVTARILSGFGDWISTIALLIFLSKLQFKGVTISILFILQLLPYIFCSPLVGNYIDGKKKKPILIISDISRGFCNLFFIALFFISARQLLTPNLILLLIYFLSLLMKVISIFFSLSYKASLPFIFKKENLKSVNSIIMSCDSITLILGPATGGLIVMALGLNTTFIINTISFFISALCIYLIRYTEIYMKPEKKNIILKYTEGWTLLKKNALLLYYTFAAALRSLLVGIMNISFVFVSRDFLPGGKDSVGFLYSALGLGIITGSFFIGSIKTKIHEKYIYLIFILSNAIFSLLYINTNLWYILLAVLFLVGVSDGITMIIFNTSLQLNIEPGHLGKVFASSNAAIMTAQLISMAVGGFLVDIFGYRFIISIAALLIILFCLAAFFLSKKIFRND